MSFNPTLPEHTVFVHPPTTTTYKPPIRRPPPKHPGVRVPGVTHPPNSGSIQDIINTLQDPHRRYDEPVKHSQPPYQGYRPPIKKIPYTSGHSDHSYIPPKPPSPSPIEEYSPYQPEYKPNFYESPVKVPNLTPEQPSFDNNHYNPSIPSNPPYQQPPSDFNPLPPVQQGHDHQQTHYHSPQSMPPTTDAKGPDITDGQGLHFANPAPVQPSSFNPPQSPTSYNPPKPPISYSPPQPSPYNPPPQPSYSPPQQPSYAPPQPTQPPAPMHSPYRPPKPSYTPPKGPLNLTPPDSYDLSKIDNPLKYNNEPYASHPNFFSQVNKMQRIELNENNHPEQGEPFNPNRYNFNSLNFATPAPRPIYTTTTPSPYNINMNTINSSTSLGNKPPVSHTYTRPPKVNYGSGMPTGVYDPNRPDGPDYSTSSKYNNNRKSPSSQLPVNIGVDVYPLQGAGHGTQTPYSNRQYEDKNNMHQVKLHLNLFSSKPSKGKPSRAISLGPFGYNENGRMYINLMQPTNHKNPSSEYDQEYYSLNEVALGSELHESTYSDENDNYQQIDHIGTEYDYYDYDYEDQDSKETKVELDENTKDNDDDYEIYYYYTYEYIDPEDLELQYERLPKPSFKISISNTTLLNDNQDLPEK